MSIITQTRDVASTTLQYANFLIFTPARQEKKKGVNALIVVKHLQNSCSKTPSFIHSSKDPEAVEGIRSDQTIAEHRTHSIGQWFTRLGDL